MAETGSETDDQAASETAGRAGGLWRDVVSLAAVLAGLAVVVVCLVHLGWWATGVVGGTGVACLGLVGALRRVGGDEPAVQQHVIEVRHVDDDSARQA